MTRSGTLPDLAGIAVGLGDCDRGCGRSEPTGGRMTQRLNLVTLGVTDLGRGRRFYGALNARMAASG